MDFFSKLGSKISTGANAAASKANDLAKTAKLNMQISSNETAIKNKFTEIGKAFYEANKGLEAPAGYEASFSAVNELYDAIKATKEELKQLKGIVKKCAKCGAESTDDTTFCSICGSAMEAVEAPAEAVVAGKACSSCGSIESDNTSFCSKCGNKF